MNLNYAIKFVTIYAQIPLDSSRPTWHHSTRLTCRVYAFWLSSLSNSTARHSRHDELNWFDTQLSLLYNLYKVRICTLFTNLLELYIYLIHVIWGNRICVCKSIKRLHLYRQALKLVRRLPCWNSTAHTLISTRSTHQTCWDMTIQVEFGPAYTPRTQT